MYELLERSSTSCGEASTVPRIGYELKEKLEVTLNMSLVIFGWQVAPVQSHLEVDYRSTTSSGVCQWLERSWSRTCATIGTQCPLLKCTRQRPCVSVLLLIAGSVYDRCDGAHTHICVRKAMHIDGRRAQCICVVNRLSMTSSHDNRSLSEASTALFEVCQRRLAALAG